MTTIPTPTAILSPDVIAKITNDWDLSPETITALENLKDGDKIPALIDLVGDDVERYGFSWSDIAEEEWDDDCGEHIYQLDKGVFAHIGNYVRMVSAAESIEEFLSYWDCDDYGSSEGLLVSFGLSPDLDEVDEDFLGPVRVWISYNYYQGTCGAPQDAWITEDEFSRAPRVFDTYADAAEWIEKTEDAARGYKSETDPRGRYMLAHGEASPPDYTICRA